MAMKASNEMTDVCVNGSWPMKAVMSLCLSMRNMCEMSGVTNVCVCQKLCILYCVYVTD